MKLTARERECLHWVSQGKTAEEISMILRINVFTVQRYLRDIRMKLNATTIAQAVYEAICQKMI